MQILSICSLANNCVIMLCINSRRFYMSSAKQSEKDVKSPKPKSFIKKLLIIIAIVFTVIITGAGLGFITASIQSMPSLNNDFKPAASSQIFDSKGRLVTTIHSAENRLPVALNSTPKSLQYAFIAAEDARFYQHFGIDPRGILRAIWSNISNRGVSEGGSTITQQLARNTLLTQDRTLKRKIQEAILAIQIERNFSKNEILEMYMNQIYFGQGAYGVQTASQVYFGKNVDKLTLAEAAMIAGLPQSPNYYSPATNMKAAKERQSVVLDQMVKYGYIDEKAAQQAKAQEIKLVKRVESAGGTTAPYFVDYVIQTLIDQLGADAVYKNGLKIYTTLDIDMQNSAEKSIKQLPTHYTDSNGIKQPQVALVAVETNTGHIKAMVGGRGTDQFNRAVLAERQPGSAFKPFVYLAAIESGLSPSSPVDDTKVTFGSWSPNNYDFKFHGRVSLSTALENSYNIAAVRLADHVGVDKPIYYAQQMGISTLVTTGYTNDRNLSMSLGGLTRGVTPLEIASAFGVLANQGVRNEPVAIIKVVDRNGKILYQSTPKQKHVINEKSAYILTNMMKGVMTRGTGTAANIGKPAAGKTGTTSEYKDAWFVGFTPDLSTAVWIGADTNDSLGGMTGGDVPASIWHDFMVEATTKYPTRDFSQPSGVTPNDLPNEKIQPAKPSALLDEKKEPDPKDKDKDKDAKGSDKPIPPPPPKPTPNNPATTPANTQSPNVPMPPKPEPKKN